MMKMGEVMDRAIRGKNSQAAVMVSDFLSLRGGMNYDEQFAFLKKRYPRLTLAQWDALLYEGEYESELRKWDMFAKNSVLSEKGKSNEEKKEDR